MNEETKLAKQLYDLLDRELSENIKLKLPINKAVEVLMCQYLNTKTVEDAVSQNPDFLIAEAFGSYGVELILSDSFYKDFEEILRNSSLSKREPIVTDLSDKTSLILPDGTIININQHLKEKRA